MAIGGQPVVAAAEVAMMSEDARRVNLWSGGPTPARARRSQRGASLLEALVAIVVTSVLLLGVLNGFLTTAHASSRGGQDAAAEEALTGVIERMSTMSYRKCASLSQVNADLTAWAQADRPAGFVVSVTSVKYLVAGSSSFATTCGTDAGAQLLTVRVVSTREDRVAKDGQLVLRNPTARPA